MTLTKNRFALRLLVIPALLLIPLIASQVSAEVNWSGLDFLVMGALLLAAISGVELVRYLFKEKKQRFFFGAVLLLALLLLWAEMAVGLFGSPLAGS